MEQKGFHRKLTAILSADVAGYSRLMQDDEAATVTTLESYKQAFFDIIKQHRGRVVDSPGDNLLAEFASVVDAVQCAVDGLNQAALHAVRQWTYEPVVVDGKTKAVKFTVTIRFKLD